MGNCQICQTKVDQLDKEGFMHHLLVTKAMDDGHIHVHGDLENKKVMEELINVAKDEIGLDKGNLQTLDKKEYVFHNRQRIGDILMFTCAVRDFKKAYPDTRVNVVSTAMHIWDYNPYIDSTLKVPQEEYIKIGPGKLTNWSNRLDWHFANAYRMSIEDSLKISIPQGESRPDIWFSEEEYYSSRVFKDPYWIICTTGEKGWGCKMYPYEKWQKFVNQHPDKLFIQIGAKGDNAPRLQGSNIIDYIGKTEDRNTGVRDLFKLFLNSEGSIGLVSFHMHLSGALYKPCIVIAGGREPVSFTRYEGHRYLSDDGCLPCSIKACWYCDINRCTNLVHKEEQKIPKCVDIIDPEDLTRAMNMYYRGGRLKKGIPMDKPPLRKGEFGYGVNVVKAPRSINVHLTETSTNKQTYGMSFGGGSLTENDWQFINSIIKQYNIKTCLEFGAGLSTLLFNDLSEFKVKTFETDPEWLNKIKAIKPNCDINLWDGKGYLPENIGNIYDLCFVDGPSGGINREVSTRIASLLADFVIVHDAGREWEKKWQEMYLVKEFDGPIKGGHRCHLWVRKDKAIISEAEQLIKTEEVKVNFIPEQARILKAGSKLVKIVSTARGWGGCARSVTTMMKLLLKNGHRVEFVPFRNSVSAREYKELLSNELKKVKVSTSYNSLKEHCDVILIYADDFVWEFNHPEIVDYFSDINADKKIMMLNFRRGKVGIIPWTKCFDKYMFLNSTQEKELLSILPEAKTKVLPSCTDLTDFLQVSPDYEDPRIRIVRHSSQNDSKFCPNSGEEISSALESREDLLISMIPGPSFVQSTDRFLKLPKTNDTRMLAKFLASGNLFWYSLPQGYMDMGPRVIIEAMAVGLPVIADNWGGAVDRVTGDCGWLCSTKQEQIDIIKNVTTSELKRMGQAAKQRAADCFAPEAWLKELVGDL